jgi:Dephospho-CoA kinase
MSGQRRSYVIALTGGVAAGKSAVSKRFESLGIHVYDADIASREAIAPGTEGLQAIIDRFGHEALDAGGQLDRAESGSLATMKHDVRSKPSFIRACVQGCTSRFRRIMAPTACWRFRYWRKISTTTAGWTVYWWSTLPKPCSSSDWYAATVSTKHWRDA